MIEAELLITALSLLMGIFVYGITYEQRKADAKYSRKRKNDEIRY